MPAESRVSTTAAKASGESHRAPLRLMTQFLRAVSESRMEDALALAQTILKFEPQNAIILDYQATLAQYINNEREEESAREGDSDNGGDEKSSRSEKASETSTSSEDRESEVSTEEASGDETPPNGSETERMAGASGGDVRNKVSSEGAMGDENELRHLGGVLKQLRETRVAESREVASRWDEEKFAADRREVEEVLWKFLPDEEKRAAEKRAVEEESGSQRRSRGHKD